MFKIQNYSPTKRTYWTEIVINNNKFWVFYFNDKNAECLLLRGSFTKLKNTLRSWFFHILSMPWFWMIHASGDPPPRPPPLPPWMTRLGLFFTRIITSNLPESMHWAFFFEPSKISFTTMVWGSIFYNPIYIEKWRHLSMMTKMPRGKPPSSLGAHPSLNGK